MRTGEKNPLRGFEKRDLLTYKMFNVQKFCILTFQKQIIRLKEIMVYKPTYVYILHLALQC